MKTTLSSEFNKRQFQERLENLPQRIFLDSNVVQYINDFGEFIFDNYNENENYFVGPKGKKIKREDFLFQQIIALRQIFIAVERTPFEFAISQGVYDEIRKKNDHHLIRWFYDLWDYWQTVVQEHDGNAFAGHGKLNSNRLQSDKSLKEALSQKDFKIFSDAVELECDAILTCDKYRHRQEWIYKKYGLMVLYPTDFIELTADFQSLWY